MSVGSWRLVGVKMATNDLFFTTMGLPSVRRLTDMMLRRYRCKLPAILGHYSSSIYHGPCQAFGNWSGVAATIEGPFQLPKSDAMVRCINTSVL
jgi:hypothetical protein